MVPSPQPTVMPKRAMVSTKSWNGWIGGTSRKSTWTFQVAAGEEQATAVSTTERSIVVPGVPESTVIAAVPWPEAIVPPVSVHA